MPGRHTAPRHKAPRSLSRLCGRIASAADSVFPSSGVAFALVCSAGIATTIGAVSLDADARTTATALVVKQPKSDSQHGDADLATRDSNDQQVSRSASRPSILAAQRAAKHGAMPVSHQSVTGRVTQTVAPADPRDIARLMLADFGWSDQFSCLDQLYLSESNWDPSATNASSGAYGIPQSLPAEKMATAGRDWRTNPATQLAWGLDYIRSSYGTPCSAWYFKQANNWY